MTDAALVGVPLGLAAGSVAGAALTRWPVGLTLGRPARSRCDACRTPLRPSDLVPILAWIILRGRCRSCGTVQRLGQPALEALCAVLVAAALAIDPSPIGALLGVVGVSLALAAALDLTHRWIPDRLTLPLGAVALPAALAIAAAGRADARSVILHGLGVPALLLLLRAATVASSRGPWLRGGDVKLLVPVLATAALLPTGPELLWMGTIASGGSLAVVGLATRALRRDDRLPFVPFLLLGWGSMLVIDLCRVPR